MELEKDSCVRLNMPKIKLHIYCIEYIVNLLYTAFIDSLYMADQDSHVTLKVAYMSTFIA